MYGSNLILPSHRMLSHQTALQKWASIKPIRGRATDTRPLAQRRNDNLTIRLDPTTNDVVVRLYSTDIIRYEASTGLIHLDPYASTLTNSVVQSILAPHVNPYWGARGTANVTRIMGAYYYTPDYAVVQPDQAGWQLVAGDKPFEVPYLNRKLGKQALMELGYYDYELNLKTQLRLGIDTRSGYRWRSAPYDWGYYEASKYISDRDQWHEITVRMSPRCSVERELASLRKSLYQYAGAYEVQTVPHFSSYSEVHDALRRIKEFS